jgi:protein TonB
LSRSLILAFLCALILHSVAVFVELDAFKRPLSFKVSPKTLTMNIVVPQPVKKTYIDKKPLIAVKKAVEKKRILKKAMPKKRVGPTVARKKKVQPERPVMKERLPEKEETPPDLSPADFPAINEKEDDFFEEDTVFLPDMVDIPLALPDIDYTPHKKKKDEVPDLPSDIPITYAQPIYKSNISPPYPLLARKRGYQGTVLLEVLVSKDGQASCIQLARSSGYKILDRAAIQGVEGWLFYPAKRGDELCEMWVKIPIRFTLN